MNRIQRTRRVAAALTGLALTWLLLATAAPAAFARVVPAQGGPGGAAAPAAVPAVTRTVLVGGTPGWQIALIATGAALLAAGLAVLADRAWTAHRKTALSAT
jgi:hypothetical protein